MSEGAFSRPLVAGAGVQKMMTEGLPHRPSQLLDTLGELDFQMAVTVPDGWLGQLLVQIENHVDMQLIRATHEEEALAIACGARIGGADGALGSERWDYHHGRGHGLTGDALSDSLVDLGFI